MAADQSAPNDLINVKMATRLQERVAIRFFKSGRVLYFISLDWITSSLPSEKESSARSP